MSLLADLRVLYRMALSPIRGDTHAERLESFYAKQAGDYDGFREKLLHGREELYRDRLPVPASGVWVEVGGGTGRNLDYLGDRIRSLGQVIIVDLSASLLREADERIARCGWTNVKTLNADATAFSLPEGQQADVITFSYSLTMIPDWFAAIDRALELLRPGGHVGVVDFYVSRKWPAEGRRKHGWFTRTFWPTWFSFDNVHPNPDHLPYLHQRFKPVFLAERRGKVPYLLGLSAPHYLFVGQKI